MAHNQNKENEIIEKEIHCPYCNTDHAVLLSKTTSKKISIQLPAYGLKFLLSLFYLSIVQVMIHGFKLIEAVKVIDNVTYAFCPNCGNSYSMAPPDVIREEVKAPKFCRIKKGKVVMGMCTGISEYTGIPLLWVRIMTVLYGVTMIGAILYFLIGACVPYKENAEEGIQRGEFYRIQKGKDITGLCKGFSVYTDIPVMWVRIFAVLSISTIIGPILYFIISAFVPVKEKVEQGIVRKRLYKTKNKKVFLGLCAGFAEYSNMPLWLVRLLTIVLIFPMALYFIIAAIVPTEEEENA